MSNHQRKSHVIYLILLAILVLILNNIEKYYQWLIQDENKYLMSLELITSEHANIIKRIQKKPFLKNVSIMDAEQENGLWKGCIHAEILSLIYSENSQVDFKAIITALEKSKQYILSGSPDESVVFFSNKEERYRLSIYRSNDYILQRFPELRTSEEPTPNKWIMLQIRYVTEKIETDDKFCAFTP